MTQHLVLQGADVDTVALKFAAKLTGSTQIQQIHPSAFRLLGGSPHPQLAELCEAAQLDFGWVPGARRLQDFGLFVTDMDSTLISIECIDEIADMAGVKAEVAEVTEAAMRGEIDFRESLLRRVSYLKGLDASALEHVYAERLQLNPGAEVLLQHLKAAGLKTVLVSGGFTYFTQRLKERLGFDYAFANILEVVDGKLTGNVLGEIVDAAAKRRVLETLRDRLNLRADQTIAMGDGANDLDLFAAASVSCAYQAKPVVRVEASYALDFNGLDALLPLLGFPA
ncbi:phosphoserine phosphatase SerB [Niveibacterium sp. SC-1]|uniref:phosphoserine phosphatase SerB n=1 Tax=Niveibacterium sp. SC-1 TaxID=3135646 RepID=UPI00311E1CC8